MFREGPDGFKGGLSAGNYSTITGASPATTTRDLADLIEKGAVIRTGEKARALRAEREQGVKMHFEMRLPHKLFSSFFRRHIIRSREPAPPLRGHRPIYVRDLVHEVQRLQTRLVARLQTDSTGGMGNLDHWTGRAGKEYALANPSGRILQRSELGSL
jgi:hypothetical protein